MTPGRRTGKMSVWDPHFCCRRNFLYGSNWLIQTLFPRAHPVINIPYGYILFWGKLLNTPLHKCITGNYLLWAASYWKGVSERRQKHTTFVTPISNISANEKAHKQGHTPLTLNGLQIRTFRFNFSTYHWNTTGSNVDSGSAAQFQLFPVFKPFNIYRHIETRCIHC